LPGCTLPLRGTSPQANRPAALKGAPFGRPSTHPLRIPDAPPQLWPAIQGSSRFPQSLTGHLGDWTSARFPAFAMGTWCVRRRRPRRREERGPPHPARSAWPDPPVADASPTRDATRHRAPPTPRSHQHRRLTSKPMGCLFPGPGRMPGGPDAAGVDADGPFHVADGVVFDDHVVEDAFPGTVRGPDPQAFVGGLPRAVAVGQIPPWRTGAQFPQDRVDHLAMVTPPTTGRGLTQPMPQSGVLAQRIFGLDVRGLLPLGLRFSAAPGRRVRGSGGAASAGRLAGPGAREADAIELGGDPRDRHVADGGVAFGLVGLVADDPPDPRCRVEFGLLDPQVVPDRLVAAWAASAWGACGLPSRIRSPAM